MSDRKWRPGDVALIRVGTGEWEYGVRRDDGTWGCRHTRNGFADRDVAVRPLVVIDPESDDVERLAELFCSAYPNEGWVELMRNALREFADPKPRIEEPTGLGAVVEGRNNETYVHIGTHDDDSTWACARTGYHFSWLAIDAVRIVSEGVTP